MKTLSWLLTWRFHLYYANYVLIRTHVFQPKFPRVHNFFSYSPSKYPCRQPMEIIIKHTIDGTVWPVYNVNVCWTYPHWYTSVSNCDISVCLFVYFFLAANGHWQPPSEFVRLWFHTEIESKWIWKFIFVCSVFENVHACHQFSLDILMHSHKHFASIITNSCINLNLVKRWDYKISASDHICVRVLNASISMNYWCIISRKPWNEPQDFPNQLLATEFANWCGSWGVLLLKTHLNFYLIRLLVITASNYSA